MAMVLERLKRFEELEREVRELRAIVKQKDGQLSHSFSEESQSQNLSGRTIELSIAKISERSKEEQASIFEK